LLEFFCAENFCGKVFAQKVFAGIEENKEEKHQLRIQTLNIKIN